MLNRMLLKSLVVLLCSVAGSSVMALSLTGERPLYSFEQEQWTEDDTPLPAYPDQKTEWLPFYAGAIATNQTSIAANSLSIGKDEVVRYILKVETPEKTVNLSYEGLDCKKSLYKRYAFGRIAEKRWQPARTADWMPLPNGDINRHHAVLMTEYFCPDGHTRPSVNVIEEALRRSKGR